MFKIALIGIPILGFAFAWWIHTIPSRIETALLLILISAIPTLRWPKFGAYYLLSIPLIIPLFRRMYYLLADRPKLDFLMIIEDGVMAVLLLGTLLLAAMNKDRFADRYSKWVVIFFLWMLFKVFIGNHGSLIEGLYGFKFNGLYILFFFVGSHILKGSREHTFALKFSGIFLIFSALWSLNQSLFGFTSFENAWINSITFTTLQIDGIIRPFGTYVSPAAMSDGMLVLLFWGLFWAERGGGHRIIGIAVAGLAVVPLLLATVRTSWAAAIAGIGFYYFFIRLKKPWLRWSTLLILVTSMTLFLARSDSGTDHQNATLSRHLQGSQTKTEILITQRTAALANPLQEYSVQKRISIWAEILFFSIKYPFGRGQGTHGYAHSYYLQVLGEAGYPGILLFLTLLVMGFKCGFRILDGRYTSSEITLARIYLTWIFVFSILNLTGTHLHTHPGDIFYWLSLGGLAQISRRSLEDGTMELSPSSATITPSQSGQLTIRLTPSRR
jgi:hypothetical protein